jgi:hypothetical protein
LRLALWKEFAIESFKRNSDIRISHRIFWWQSVQQIDGVQAIGGGINLWNDVESRHRDGRRRKLMEA